MCGNNDGLHLIEDFELDLPEEVDVVQAHPLDEPGFFIVVLADRGTAEWTEDRIADAFEEIRANLSASHAQGELTDEEFEAGRALQDEQLETWQETGIVAYFIALLHPSGLELRQEPYVSLREVSNVIPKVIEDINKVD